MKTNRRSFLKLAPGGAGSLGEAGNGVPLHAISARGREAWEAENGFRGAPVFVPPPAADEVRISSNENPLGPGGGGGGAARPVRLDHALSDERAESAETDLRRRIGEMYGGKAGNVVLAPGSSEILRKRRPGVHRRGTGAWSPASAPTRTRCGPPGTSARR